MELDLENSDRLVELVIAKRCSKYGAVTAVEVDRNPSPFALVKMSRCDQTAEVATQYQGSLFGNAALIRLEHKSE